MKIELYQILLIIYAIVNIFAFILMFIDKRRAVYGSGRRIPEGVIFFYSAIFGSLGIFLGMHLLRHKTRKWYFNIALPLFLVQNIILIYFIYQYL